MLKLISKYKTKKNTEIINGIMSNDELFIESENTNIVIVMIQTNKLDFECNKSKVDYNKKENRLHIKANNKKEENASCTIYINEYCLSKIRELTIINRSEKKILVDTCCDFEFIKCVNCIIDLQIKEKKYKEYYSTDDKMYVLENSYLKVDSLFNEKIKINELNVSLQESRLITTSNIYIREAFLKFINDDDYKLSLVKFNQNKLQRLVIKKENISIGGRIDESKQIWNDVLSPNGKKYLMYTSDRYTKKIKMPIKESNVINESIAELMRLLQNKKPTENINDKNRDTIIMALKNDNLIEKNNRLTQDNRKDILLLKSIYLEQDITF